LEEANLVPRVFSLGMRLGRGLERVSERTEKSFIGEERKIV